MTDLTNTRRDPLAAIDFAIQAADFEAVVFLEDWKRDRFQDWPEFTDFLARRSVERPPVPA